MVATIRASFSRIRPNSEMGLPKAFRSLAYGAASATTLRQPATQVTPSLSRPMLRMLKAMRCPLPISPSRLPTGIRASSKMSGRVELPRMPILCSSGPVVNPGASFSTMKALNFSPSTLAKTMKTSAKPALEIHCLVPFRIQCFPSGERTARVFAAMASEAEEGSESA